VKTSNQHLERQAAQAKKFGHETRYTKLERPYTLGGIGAGSILVIDQVIIPVATTWTDNPGGQDDRSELHEFIAPIAPDSDPARYHGS